MDESRELHEASAEVVVQFVMVDSDFWCNHMTRSQWDFYV